MFSIISFAQNRVVVISQTAHFREQPNNKSKIILTVKKGARFILEPGEHKNGWYYVSVYMGEKGWIYGNNIKISKPNDDLPDLSKYEVNTAPEKSSETQTVSKNSISDNKKEKEWKVVDFSLVDEKITAVKQINLNRIIRKQNIVEFWIKEFPLNSEKHYERKTYTLIQYTADCLNKKIGLLYVAEYKPGEKSPVVESFDGRMEPVIPESVGEVVVTEACSIK